MSLSGISVGGFQPLFSMWVVTGVYKYRGKAWELFRSEINRVMGLGLVVGDQVKYWETRVFVENEGIDRIYRSYSRALSQFQNEFFSHGATHCRA